MSEFVAGTCAVSGQYSDQCVVTRWVAAKELGFVQKEAPGGWTTDSWNWGVGRRMSDFVTFEVCLSKEAIQDRQRKRSRATRFLAAFVAFAVIVWAAASAAATEGYFVRSGPVNEALKLVPAILFWVAMVGLAILFWTWWLRIRPRYATMVEFEPLDDEAHKRIAYSLSKRIAEKQASESGRDLVWSESRFKEKLEQDEWVIPDEDTD